MNINMKAKKGMTHTEKVAAALERQATAKFKRYGHEFPKEGWRGGVLLCARCGEQACINPMPMMGEMTIYGGATFRKCKKPLTTEEKFEQAINKWVNDCNIPLPSGSPKLVELRKLIMNVMGLNEKA